MTPPDSTDSDMAESAGHVLGFFFPITLAIGAVLVLVALLAGIA
jgi:hypothetical protein